MNEPRRGWHGSATRERRPHGLVSAVTLRRGGCSPQGASRPALTPRPDCRMWRPRPAGNVTGSACARVLQRTWDRHEMAARVGECERWGGGAGAFAAHTAHELAVPSGRRFRCEPSVRRVRSCRLRPPPISASRGRGCTALCAGYCLRSPHHRRGGALQMLLSWPRPVGGGPAFRSDPSILTRESQRGHSGFCTARRRGMASSPASTPAS